MQSASTLLAVLLAFTPEARAACDGIPTWPGCKLTDADLLVEGGPNRGNPEYYIDGIGSSVDVADFDIDGVADLLISGGSAGAATIVYGPASGVISAVGQTRLTGPEFLGGPVAAGDADGDGSADALVAAPLGADTGAYLFLGPITGRRISAEADAELLANSHNHTEFSAVLGPDVDGDGQPDIVAGVPNAAELHRPNRGMVYVVSGNVTGTVDLETNATYAYEGISRTHFGRETETVGDWSGDGIDDLALTALGAVYIVDGGGTPGQFPIDDVASGIIGKDGRGAEASYFGYSLEAADYDGDGTADLFVGTPDGEFTGSGGSSVATYLGPLGGHVDVSDAYASWTGHFGSNVGASLAVGDVDGDGAQDMVTASFQIGRAYIGLGPDSGTTSVSELTTFGLMSASVATIPDWNGDGGAEVLLGRPSDVHESGGRYGAVYVFYSDTLFP